MPDAPYPRQIFVCTYGPWCRLDGSDEVRAALKQKVKEAGLSTEVRVNKSGCLSQCGHGPMAVTWPENVWHEKLALADVDDLVRVHLRGGQPLERRRYRAAKAGANKTPEVLAKEAKGKAVD